MQVDSLKRQKSLQFVTIGLLIPVLIAFFVTQATHSDLPLFNLRFNAYALLSALGVLSGSSFLFLAWRYKVKGEEAMWIVSMVGSLCVLGGGEMLQRLSATPQGAVFWGQISGIGAAFIPITLFLFALSYTRPNIRNVGLVAFLLVGAGVIIFFQVNGGLIFQITPNAVRLYPWGYNSDVGPAFIENALWIYVLCAGALALVVSARRHIANTMLRKQLMIFAIGFTIPIVGGSVTDILLPAIGKDGILPPLAVFFMSATAGSLILGLIKYKFFEFTPARLAQDILTNMRESVIVTNDRLEIEFINLEAESLLGGKLDAIAHKTLDSFFDDLGQYNLKARIEDIDTNNAERVLENITITHTDHQKIFVRIMVTEIVENKQLQGYIFAITDISELHESYELIQKQKESVEHEVQKRTLELQQEHARLEASINSLNTGFFITGTNNNIIIINQSAKSILLSLATGTDNPPAISGLTTTSPWTLQNIYTCLGSKFDIAAGIKQCIEKGQLVRSKDTDYGERILRVFMSPVLQDNTNPDQPTPALGAVVLIEDVTEEKILERSKNEFFTISSHELRTPLTKIDSSLEVIQHAYYQSLESDFKKMLDTIDASNARLTTIVDQLLEVSELEQDQAKLSSAVLSVESVIKDVVAKFSDEAQKKHIALIISNGLTGLPSVRANQDSIKKVLAGLVSNALAATVTGSITISAKIEKEKYIKVSVTDTGSGISQGNQQLLFRKFQQASDSLLVRSAGIGLGLYTARLILKNMGGDIALDQSIVGKGSTFSFTLPLYQAIDVIAG